MALGNSNGVPQAIPTDMALIGDTKMPLASKPLPKRTGPNFGYGGGGMEGSSEYRVTGSK